MSYGMNWRLTLHSISESQYKYRFKKWDWKKNISSAKKQKIIEYSQTRAQMGKSTVVRYKGKQVDARKLRREVKSIKRGEEDFIVPNTMSRPPAWLRSSGPVFGSSMYESNHLWKSILTW